MLSLISEIIEHKVFSDLKDKFPLVAKKSDSDVNIHLYHKKEIKNGRKMGHLTYIKDKKIS